MKIWPRAIVDHAADHTARDVLARIIEGLVNQQRDSEARAVEAYETAPVKQNAHIIKFREHERAHLWAEADARAPARTHQSLPGCTPYGMDCSASASAGTNATEAFINYHGGMSALMGIYSR